VAIADRRCETGHRRRRGRCAPSISDRTWQAICTHFPEANEILIEWPHHYLERTEVDSRTALCVLTHDAKFDVPLLRLALRLPVAYIVAMGSRRTHLDRNERLRKVGVSELVDRRRPPWRQRRPAHRRPRAPAPRQGTGSDGRLSAQGAIVRLKPVRLCCGTRLAIQGC